MTASTQRHLRVKRTREERELDRLRGILVPDPRKPLWSAYEASWYLAGIVEEHSQPGIRYPDGSYEAADFAWLPGARVRFDVGTPAVRDELVYDVVDYVSGFCTGRHRAPADWIRLALKNGFEPVWMSAARADPVCKAMLPDARLRNPAAPRTVSPQVLGGKAKSSGGKSLEMRSIIPDFEDWYSKVEKRPDGRPAYGLKKHFVQEMAERLDGIVQDESIANMVGRLIAAKVATRANTSC